MTRKQKRLAVIGGGMSVLVVAVTLVLVALGQGAAYFRMPSDLTATDMHPGTRIRLGGLVEKGTVDRGHGTTVHFDVTDQKKSVPVVFTGILPDLFRAGQGVIVEGTFDAGGHFVADTVLAKHDERYMPKDVEEALKAKGVWVGKDKGG
jgi:cytochrome c-type biogenesis protein CcmE